MGVNIGTIRRLRANGRFETDGILSLTQWLGRPVEEFTRHRQPGETMRFVVGENDAGGDL